MSTKRPVEPGAQEHDQHARIEAIGHEDGPGQESDRQQRTADHDGGVTCGAQRSGGVGGQQEVAAEGAADVAELIHGNARGTEEGRHRNGAESGDEEAVRSHLLADLKGEEGEQRDRNDAQGAGAAVAAIEAQPVADQRTHARSEERAHAIERAVPFDLHGLGDLALRRALFEPDEKRRQAEDPGDDDAQAVESRQVRVNHGGGRAERRRVVQPPHDCGQHRRVLVDPLREHRGQDRQRHDQQHQNGCAALALHQLIDEEADHASQQVVGGEQQQDGEEAEPEAARTEHIEPDRQPELQGEEEEPEGVENSGEMARNAAVRGGQRIAAQFRVREDGVHAEAQNIGGEHGFEEQCRERSLRDVLRLAAAHGDHGRAEAAAGKQGDEQHQQEVAGEEERDASVARTRLGPEKLVTQAD